MARKPPTSEATWQRYRNLSQQSDIEPQVILVLEDAIAQANMGLVYKAVNGSKKGFLEREDLVQAGKDGLYKAIQRFDLSRRVAFSSFAMGYIRGEIQHLRRDVLEKRGLSRDSQELQQAVARVVREMQALGETEINELQIVVSLGHTEADWQRAREEAAIALPSTLNEETVGLYVADPDEIGDTPLETLAQNEEYQSVSQVLKALGEPYCTCLRLVVCEGATLATVANRLGISVKKARKLKNRGLWRLRKRLEGLVNV